MSDAESLSAPPEKLLEWIRGVERVACTRIEARHIVAGSEGGSPVCTVEIADQGDGDERFNAPALWKRLEEDAETFGGIQRYTLFAYRDSAKSPRERLTIRVDGGTDGNASGSEPANATGLVAQAHRHNEALMTMMVRTFGTALDTLAKQNTVMREALEKANDEKVEMWGILSEAAKGDTERQNAKHVLALKEKQADVIRDSLKMAIPGLMAKILPSKALGETSLQRLIESLTDEQRSAIFATLSPEQAAALGGVLDSFIKKTEKTEKESESVST